ncbi:hypothetical protein NDU88_004138, partial [Pleurodeles waltl]
MRWSLSDLLYVLVGILEVDQSSMRAGCGAGTTLLRPLGRPLLARRLRAFRVTVAGRFSLGSGAQRFLKSSDAGEVIRRGR